jgi:hypothetical protein
VHLLPVELKVAGLLRYSGLEFETKLTTGGVHSLGVPVEQLSFVKYPSDGRKPTDESVIALLRTLCPKKCNWE